MPQIPDQIKTETAEHIRRARDGAEALRVLHQERGEPTRQQAALVMRRALEQAVSARVLYDQLDERVPVMVEPAPEPVEPEPPVIVEPEPDPAVPWVIPAGAVIRHVKPGEVLDIRRGGTVEAPLVLTSPPGTRVTVRHVWLRDPVSNVILDGFDVDGVHEQSSGILILGSGMRNIQIRNVAVRRCHAGLTIQHVPGDGPEPLQGITISRCVIRDNFITGKGGHSQGLYASGVHRLKIHDCLFDANGWDPADETTATIFNHNLYLGGCHDVEIIGNVLSRGSSFAIKIRSETPGGFTRLVIRDNLIGGCANGVTIGHVPMGVVGAHADYVVADNVLSNLGRPIWQGDTPRWQSFGVETQSLLRAQIRGNLWIDSPHDTGHPALHIRSDFSADEVTAHGNHTAGWAGPTFDLHAHVDAADNTSEPSARKTLGDFARAGYGRIWPELLDAALAGDVELSGRVISAWLRRQHGMLN